MGLISELPSKKPVPLSAYFSFLKRNREYRRLLTAEIINQGGNWLSYVASLQLATSLTTKGGLQSSNQSDHSGLTVALVLISKLLPSFFLFPAAGAAADLYDRPSTMTVSCMVSAFFIALLGFIVNPNQIALLYTVLVIVNSAEAFYEPARRALVPLICKREELQLATSLDSLAWSVMAAFGASMGGLANSKLGMRACFLLNSLTFFINALFVRTLSSSVKSAQLQTQLNGNNSNSNSNLDAAEKGSGRPAVRQIVGQEQKPGSSTIREKSAPSDPPPQPSPSPSPSSSPLGELQGSSQGGAGGQGGPSKPTGLIGALLDAGIKMREGAHFIGSRENRDIAFVCTAKAWGGLLWGFADIVAVRFSHEKKFQGLGDSSQTMGLIFGAVGVGCILGPVLANYVTRPDPSGFLRGIAYSFICLNLGYLLMYLAPDIYWLMLASGLRAQGSTVLWTYSTLILQLRVANDMLGRVSALELAIYYLLECTSGLASGIVFDRYRLTPTRACLGISVIALIPSVIWLGASIYLGNKWGAGMSPATSSASLNGSGVGGGAGGTLPHANSNSSEKEPRVSGGLSARDLSGGGDHSEAMGRSSAWENQGRSS